MEGKGVWWGRSFRHILEGFCYRAIREDGDSHLPLATSRTSNGSPE
jgi:hypothetical protein